jgi:hypothetical protein
MNPNDLEELKLHDLKKIVDMFRDYSNMRELRNFESSVKIEFVGIEKKHNVIYFHNKRIGYICFDLNAFKNALNKLDEESLRELGVVK